MRIKLLSFLVLTLCLAALSGCVESAKKDNVIFNRYYLTTLKISKSSEIVPLIKDENELISQSENAIASWGERSKGRIIWFNAITFDEDYSTASRKYGFISNEKARGWFNPQGQTLRLDLEAVINPEVLEAPYANENAKKIAVLESVIKDFDNDFIDLTIDSKTLQSAYLMANQALLTVLNKLKQSPALAEKLDRPGGLNYDHMNYDAGKVRMVIDNDIVKIKTMTGKTIKDFEEKPEILSM